MKIRPVTAEMMMSLFDIRNIYADGRIVKSPVR